MTGSHERDFDVAVVGSGASGLTAALRAADAGARVVVLEKSSFLGGTSALSGGMIWMPGNGLPEAPEPDADRENARRYLAALTLGRADPELLDQHIDRVPAVLEFLADAAGLEFDVIAAFPDYESQMDGGCDGGRSLEPRLYSIDGLGGLAAHIRDDPRPPFRQCEYFEGWKTLRNIPLEALARRREQGIVARGMALVAPLVKALAERGATLIVDCPAQRLVVENDRVTGVQAGGAAFEAADGVVLAAGGFEWNDEMCGRFLSGPVQTRCGTPNNVGDGQRMGMAAGADLGGMNEAWWGVMADVPGLEVDGRAVGTLFTVERCLPGSIVVNPAGRRFMNEAKSYYGIGKIFAAFDQSRYGYANLPAYLIADATFYERYGILGADQIDDVPDWITVAGSLRELAARLDIDADGLEQTVERFNEQIRGGHDDDFHRGETPYENYLGDAESPHPNLAAVERAPFVAIEVKAGAIGTKGGVRTDADGRALNPFSEVIDGLFAVGNNSAHPIAFGYAGAGSTLGPGMTMGYAAGAAVAPQRVRG